METKVRTVTEVIQGLKEWEVAHGPFDRFSKLNLFQFVIEEARADGGKAYGLVPLRAGEQTEYLPAIILKPHAMGQLLARFQFPKQLYDKLPPKLNLLNLNYLMQHGAYDRDVMLRVMDSDQCRALMSSSYAPFDTLELLTLAEPYLHDGIVRWHFDDEMTFHISVTFPKTAEVIAVGDVVEQGIHISNSEVGVRSVTIAGFVYRLKCKNGQVGGGDSDSFRFRHVGGPDRLRQMVEAAINSTKLEATKVIAQMKAAIQTAIDKPHDFLEKIAKERDLTQEQFKAALDSLLEEPEHQQDLFGMSQSFSRAAQKFEGETTYELMRTATQVLSLAAPGGRY